MGRVRLAVVHVAATTVALASASEAQRPAPAWSAVAASAAAATVPARDRPAWIFPTASFVLPGSGQFLAGQGRGMVYVALESFLAMRYFSYRADARRERDFYRDLAFTVARAPFDPTVRDTTFEYFEKLEKYVESGPLDTDPGPAFAPPSDVRTYNGAMWELAKRTFFLNPDSIPAPESEEYQRALAFYLGRAVGPDFSWSWRNAGLEQDLYRRSIRASDEGFRRATQHLGLLLANHLLSAVDAFVSSRLSRRGRVKVGTVLWQPGGSGAVGWAAVVRLRM